MSTLGKKLIAAVEESREKGLVSLNATPNIKQLRKNLNLSQKAFSDYYKINLDTLKAWEQHKRQPDSISRAYLTCIEKAPETILRLIQDV
ncbi:MAG: transcriptional regulator [Gammaproteobacteria bacterium]|nr:transcriptional regulator [Gammaproteobacteria bacterium]